jgi:lipid II:glycine glycyltransferase (peptidoglycan interpeptide bridge formation enzyme)
MPDIEVRDLKKEDYESWDLLVDASPHGTIFHRSSWLMMSSEFFDRELKILGYFDDGTLVGGCSFFAHKAAKGMFRIASSTTSMTPYGGFVLSQPSKGKSSCREQELKHREIIESLCIAIDEGNFDSVQFTNTPEFTDIRPFTWSGWRANIYYTYYLNLELSTRISSRDVKRNIKKATENNLKIRKEFDLSTYYDLFSMTFEKQNMKPPVSDQYFKRIINLLENTGIGEMVICDTSSGEAASAHITLWDNKRAYSWSNASHPELIKTGSNYLLISEISIDLKNKGFKEFNLMRGNVPQLSNFAVNFNPNLVPYYEVERSCLKLDAAKNQEKFYRLLSKGKQ